MEKIPKRVYTKEFKEQAAQRVVRDGLRLTDAARRLSIWVKTLSHGVSAAKHGKRVNVGAVRKPVTELEAEVARLRRELTETKMERDLLKKRRRTSQRKRGEVRPSAAKTMRGWKWRSRQHTCAHDRATARSACRTNWPPTAFTPAWAASSDCASDGESGAEIQSHDEFQPRVGGGGEAVATELQHRSAPSSVGHRHHLRSDTGRLVVPLGHQRPAHVRNRRLRAGRAHDEGAGITCLVRCRVAPASAAGTHSPLGSRQPVLRARPPAVTAAVPHELLDESQRQLLRQRPDEKLLGSLKTELVHHQRYETRAQATREITEYIEIFYNRQRRHSKLGNLAPAVFAQQHQKRVAA